MNSLNIIWLIINLFLSFLIANDVTNGFRVYSRASCKVSQSG